MRLDLPCLLDTIFPLPAPPRGSNAIQRDITLHLFSEDHIGEGQATGQTMQAYRDHYHLKHAGIVISQYQFHFVRIFRRYHIVYTK